MWFPRWKSVLDDQSPARPFSTAVAVQAPDQSFVEYGQEPKTASTASGRSSLWRSACIALLFSAFGILFQVGRGQGFELANVAHAPTMATIVTLLVRVLLAPLIFVLIAILRNLLNAQRKKSTASALLGALTFAMLLALIVGGLAVYIFPVMKRSVESHGKHLSLTGSICVFKNNARFPRTLPKLKSVTSAAA